MSWFALKECFPPTKDKKEHYRRDHIVQRLIKSNPAIREDEFLDFLADQDQPLFHTVLNDHVNMDRKAAQARPVFIRRIAIWYDQSTSTISNKLFRYITRNWDKGEHVNLTEDEKAALLEEYGYSLEPPSQ